VITGKAFECSVEKNYQLLKLISSKKSSSAKMMSSSSSVQFSFNSISTVRSITVSTIPSIGPV